MSQPATEKKIILVTGANRGIGLAIIQSLASHPQTSNNSILLLGCRDISKGEVAIRDLKTSCTDLDDTSNIRPIELDVTSDSSIREAVAIVRSTYGRLDVLVNNAGFASIPKASDYSDVRPSFAETFAVNVTSVYMTTTLFLPLLKLSSIAAGGEIINANAKVINISSARGSLTRSASGQLPPTAAVGYSVSKTALNALTVEMAKANEDVEFQLACPGHCRTAFNGFRGVRDPVEGADVVVELTLSERKATRSWETVGSDRVLREVPW